MKDKRNVWLPILLMVVFAASRWPGLLPVNFSAAYALLFCAGVYFPRRMAWWLPLATMLVTDTVLGFYYYYTSHHNPLQVTLLFSYGAYAVLIWLGRRCRPSDSWLKLLGGGVIGAILFYLITNTAAWLFNPFNNPEYTKNLAGWIAALTTGTAGWPHTWEFFRNTLLSGGLFTGLFAGAMKLSEKLESALDKESEPVKAEEPEESEAPEPEQAKA